MCHVVSVYVNVADRAAGIWEESLERTGKRDRQQTVVAIESVLTPSGGWYIGAHWPRLTVLTECPKNSMAEKRSFEGKCEMLKT